MKIDPGYVIEGSAAERATARSVAWQAPGLPSMAPWTIPRFDGAPTWTPPGTRPLTRHVAADGRRFVSADRLPPRGFEIEFDLGLVHVFGQIGTSRILRTPDGFLGTPTEGGLADGYAELGHVEQAAFPMLTPLELCRIPESGQVTLVCGPADPLFETTEHLATLGFVDSYPLEPRKVADQRSFRFTVSFWRRIDPLTSRHVYTVADDQPVEESAALGGIWSEPAAGFVALRLRSDGTVESDLLSPAGGRPRAKDVARWVGAPLSWSEARLPEPWSVRATAGRARRVVPVLASRRAKHDAVLLGYVRKEPRRGWKPLISATHLVTGDQFLTRSEMEANDLGYRIDGVLGYVSMAGIDGQQTGLGQEIPWASRFGQRRRYVEPA